MSGGGLLHVAVGAGVRHEGVVAADPRGDEIGVLTHEKVRLGRAVGRPDRLGGAEIVGQRSSLRRPRRELWQVMQIAPVRHRSPCSRPCSGGVSPLIRIVALVSSPLVVPTKCGRGRPQVWGWASSAVQVTLALGPRVVAGSTGSQARKPLAVWQREQLLLWLSSMASS